MDVVAAAVAAAAAEGFAPSAAASSAPPVALGGFSAIADAARQQTELLFWVAQRVQEHEQKIEKLLKTSASGAGDNGSRKWSPAQVAIEGSDGADGASSAPRQRRASREALWRNQELSVPVPAATVAPAAAKASGGTESQAPPEPSTPKAPLSPPHTAPLPKSLGEDALPSAFVEAIERAEATSVEALRLARCCLETSEQASSDIAAVDEEMDRKLQDFANFMNSEIARAGEKIQERLQGSLGAIAGKALEAVLPSIREDLGKVVSDRIDSKFSAGLSQSLEKLGGPPSAAPANGGAAPAAAVPANTDMMVSAVRMMHEDVKARLPALEQGVQEVKNLRLKIPALVNEIVDLQAKFKKLESDGKRKSRGASLAFPAEDSDGDDGGAAAGATAYAGLSRMSRKSTHEPAAEIVIEPAPAASAQDTKPEVQDLKNRAEQIETLAKRSIKQVSDEALAKVRAATQLVTILEDRLMGVDEAFRMHEAKANHKLDLITAKFETEKDERIKLQQSWNLAHQVDVIQSLMQQELKYVKAQLEGPRKRGTTKDFSGARGGTRDISGAAKKLKARAAGDDGGEEAMSPEHDDETMADVQEKIRRLQEQCQSFTLKLAGFKVATRNIEVNAEAEAEKVTRLAGNLEEVSEKATRSEVRLEYLSLHGAASHRDLCDGVGAATTFSGAIGWTEGVATLGQAPEVARTPLGKRRASLDPSIGIAGAPAMLSPGAVVSSAPRPGRRLSLPQLLEESGTVTATPVAVAAPLVNNVNLEIELSTLRIARLGKKVSDMDTDLKEELKKYWKEAQQVSMQLNQIVAFLPRRQRRVVESILLEHAQETLGRSVPSGGFGDPDFAGGDLQTGGEDGQKNEGADEKGKKLRFNDVIETRKYNVVEDTLMPWQLVGEPDQKWNWCYSQMHDLGRELARHFETLDHEREEFEKEMKQTLEDMRHTSSTALFSAASSLKSAPDKVAIGTTRTLHGRRGAEVEPEKVKAQVEHADFTMHAEKFRRQLDQAVLPHLASLEERMERMLQESKKQFLRKADKEDIEGLTMRLEIFEKIEPKHLLGRIEAFEQSQQIMEQLVDSVSVQMRNLEGQMAHRNELMKVRTETQKLMTDFQVVHTETKAVTQAVYTSNRHVSTTIAEMKTMLDKQVGRLQDEKVGTKDFAELMEKVYKLEGGLKDNRQILNDAGGHEISSVVKRIILNLEDKIMVLEKKVDALAERSRIEVPRAEEGLSPRSAAVDMPSLEAVQNLGAELENVTAALAQIKQDVAMSKLDMEHIVEQGHQGMILAEKLNVFVENPFPGEAGETGSTTALSLQRVQLMVSAAARQLVAGSKWVTRETFDQRVAELRKEYTHRLHLVQAQLEEVGFTPRLAADRGASAPSNNGSVRLLPKVAGIKRIAEDLSVSDGRWETPRIFAERPGTVGTQLGAAAATVSAAGARSARLHMTQGGGGGLRPTTRG